METELKKRKVLRLSNEESHRLTRECICTALIFLMDKQPFDKITITSIIERSGVSRAAFYRNYSSKEDVMRDIFSEVAKLLSASFNRAFNGEELDKRNFRKRIKEMDFIEKTELIDKTGSKRGAYLYRFNKRVYREDPNFKL